LSRIGGCASIPDYSQILLRAAFMMDVTYPLGPPQDLCPPWLRER